MLLSINSVHNLKCVKIQPCIYVIMYIKTVVERLKLMLVNLPNAVNNLAINRGSYMSAHVSLNLLNELRKRDKMRGLPSILSLFSQRV